MSQVGYSPQADQRFWPAFCSQMPLLLTPARPVHARLRRWGTIAPRTSTLEIVMHLSLALCVLIPAAPIPPAKAPQPASRADVVGCWRMNWAGSTWFAEFTEDGQYSCWDERSGWVGYWQVDNGVLTVRERPAACQSPHYSGHAWSVRLA